MEGEQLRALFSSVFDRNELTRLAHQYGLVERERAIDLFEFLVALVLTAGTPEGGRQYDVLRTYLQNGNPVVCRQSFYAWFNEPLTHVLTAMLDRAIACGSCQPKLLPGVLGTVRDWHVVDSTTLKLPKKVFGDFPGTGEYAALKVHKEFSLGTGNLVSYQITPARVHDSVCLTIDERWRGLGLLADLAYASFERLRACDRFAVKYVIRLKEDWKPKLDRLVRGSITKNVAPGDDFDVLLETEILLLDGKSIDADVRLGKGAEALRSRLVGIPTPKGYCFFLTNLSRATHGSWQVGDLYRCRWEIEIDNKVEKSGARLDELCATKPASLRALILASLLNATLARTIVQAEKLALRKGKRLTEPADRAPFHAVLVLKALASGYANLARLLLDERATWLDWNRFMGRIRHLSQDESWRRRPSVLDKLQGLTAPPPGRLRKNAAASLS